MPPASLAQRALRIGLVVLVAVAAVGALAAGVAFFSFRRGISAPLPPEDPARSLLARREPGPGPPALPPSAVLAQQLPDAFHLADFRDPGPAWAPWTRWWWPGDHVEDAELRRQLGALRDAGFGGVEIQSFRWGALSEPGDPEYAATRGFDEAPFYEHLRTVMEEALRLGLQVDLTVGSSWPAGGPHVGARDGVRTLLFSEADVTAGASATPPALELPRPALPISYLIANAISRGLGGSGPEFFGADAELLAVVAGRVLSDGRSANPLVLNDAVRLDPQSLVVLTDRVQDGRLAWSPPDSGDAAAPWKVVAIWSLPNGEQPLAPAQADAGFVVDHFDEERLLAHYDHLLGARTGLLPYAGRPWRAFFNDSLEFKSERHVAAGMLERFEAARGYDVRPYLPALDVPMADDFMLAEMRLRTGPEYVLTDLDARIRRDWDQTVSDLFVERFLDASGRWGAERGLLSRVQAYGLRIDTLRAAGHADLPETEQLYARGADLFLKIASSGAHLYGRPLVSAETAVEMQGDYRQTAGRMKIALDKLFTAGINHAIYHGTPYRWPDPRTGPTGWAPFSSPRPGWLGFSSNVSEVAPLWRDVPALNRYAARVQYALRQGRPDVDVLVHYPFLGISAATLGVPEADETYAEGHIPGLDAPRAGDEFGALAGAVRRWLTVTEESPEQRWHREAATALRALEARGLTWDWVNDESLAVATLDAAGRTSVRGQPYAAVLLLGSPHLEPAAAENLAALAEAGALVRSQGAPPAEQPGFFEHAEGDRRVAVAAARVGRADASTSLQAFADAARAHDPARRVRYAGVLPAVRHVRRRLADGSELVFFRNDGDEPTTLTLEAAGSDTALVWLDPASGDAVRARVQDGRLQRRLGPWDSALLLAGSEDAASLASQQAWQPVAEHALDGPWTARAPDLEGSQETYELDALLDWRTHPQLRDAAHGTLRTDFELGALAPGARAILELGRVAGAAEVRVNGQPAGRLPFPPWSLDVTRHLAPGRNTLEIDVTPAWRNALRARAEAGDTTLARFRGKERVAAGLLGPVRIRVERPAAGG
jgi:hypothetical protein